MIARPDSWKREPFGPLEDVPYAAEFSPAEFERIKQGLVPGGMEDKWFIYFEEPSLFLHRSWTGRGVFRVDFERRGDQVRVSNALCETELLAKSTADYQAELLGFLVSNLLLGRAEPFPMPPGGTEQVPGVYQHVMSGTGYNEVPSRSRRQWWRFWR